MFERLCQSCNDYLEGWNISNYIVILHKNDHFVINLTQNLVKLRMKMMEKGRKTLNKNHIQMFFSFFKTWRFWSVGGTRNAGQRVVYNVDPPGHVYGSKLD